MAAPTHTTRTTPTGDMLRDGYRTLITLASNASIKFWEKSVKPPGVEGGDPVDDTTMHNTAWETSSPQSLKKMTNVTCKCAYDPAVYDQIIAAINVATTITTRFPNGARVSAFGYLRAFEADEITRGQQPEATVTFEITNWDTTNSVEAAPVYGTGT